MFVGWISANDQSSKSVGFDSREMREKRFGRDSTEGRSRGTASKVVCEGKRGKGGRFESSYDSKAIRDIRFADGSVGRILLPAGQIGGN